MQDVPAYAARAGLQFECYYDMEPAVLDADHTVRIGYEAYVFCSAEHRARFEDNLVTHCGLVTDPVTKERFRPGDDSPLAFHDDTVFLFQNIDSAETFLEAPETYVKPGWKMKKMPKTSEQEAERDAS